MPMRFEIDGSYALVTCEGEFDMTGIEEIVEWIRTEEKLPERFKLLILDRSTSFNPSTPQLSEVARLYGSVKERISSRWALVVDKKLHYGIGRMYSVIAQDYGLDARVFADIDEARAWLDSPRTQT